MESDGDHQMKRCHDPHEPTAFSSIPLPFDEYTLGKSISGAYVNIEWDGVVSHDAHRQNRLDWVSTAILETRV